MNLYSQPMQSWKDLQAYSTTVQLPKSGLRLFTYQAGDSSAAPMLLIHGLGDEADTWRHIIHPLSARFRIIAPDLPGFGRSDKPDRTYTLPFFQETMLDLLDVLQVEKVVLVGDSLGGLIAHSLALAEPERVSRLVLMGGSLVTRVQKIDPSTLLFLVPGLGEWMYNRLRKNPQSAYRSLEAYYYDLEALPAEDRQFLYQRVNERVWNDEQRRSFLSAIRNLARWIPGQQKSLPARLAGLNIPILVLWGEADRINPVANARALVAAMPDARLVIVPGAGHNFHQEKPGAVIEAIKSFV